MITAIDTNILIDIFGADPTYGLLSEKFLRRCIKEGRICACEIVWTEVSTVFDDAQECLNAMKILGVEFSHITQETALQASNIWRQYRKNGGKRTRIAADFLIGAHSTLQADRLLTRDKGFYREYFTNLKILTPI